MAAIDAQGTVISINAVTIGGVVSFSGLDGQASDIDITTLASTAKEFRQGLQDFGGLTLELIKDPNDVGQVELLTQQAAQTASSVIITLPDDVTLNRFTFNAYVKSVSLSGGVDDVARATATLKITGAVTISDSTP